ncbi:MAG: purine-binding chemotaxis protein CheW [Phycisphaerales bacterium]|nr:purine-binding chemotaxis protein CheW [Phycisphaerales bacterium]
MNATQTKLPASGSTAANQNDSVSRKYLTFHLAGEEYGIDIRMVREINGVSNITPVPAMPDYVKGVINLRGNVIPIIDLRLKFGMPEAEYNEETCIIVVDVEREVGVVVDSVSEVIDLKGADIKPAPPMGANVDNSYIVGMGSVGDSLKILIDIEKALVGVHVECPDDEEASEE